MTKLARKSLILAKTEATYGTDAGPAATDAILISNLSVTPAALQTVDRSFFRSHLGASPQLVVGQSVTLSFDVELAGSGTAVTPPGYADLFKACGLSETIHLPNKNVYYKPVSAGFGSVTVHYHADGVKHVVTGARGNLSLSMSPGAVPTCSFSITGKYAAPTDATDPVANLSKFQQPVAVNNSTASLSLHGESVVAHEFTLDLGNQVQHQDVIGVDEIRLTDRSASGNVTIDLTPVETKNWVDVAKTATLGELTFNLGDTAGATVTVTAPSVQLTEPSHGEANGVRTVSMGLRLLPSAYGNDEIVISTS